MPHRRRGGDGLRSAHLNAGPPRQQANVGFPERVTARLTYSGFGRVNPGVVTSADQIWRLNSPFDPDFTGAGHQPRGWDTLAGLYDKYRVKKCRAIVHVRQRAAHGVQAVLVPTNQSVSLDAAAFPAEIQRSTASIITGSSQPEAMLDITYQCHDVLGQSVAQYNASEDTSALTTTNPTEGVFLHTVFVQVDGVTALDIEYAVQLFYDVEFFDRRYEGPSSIAMEIANLRRFIAAHVLDDEEPPAPGPAPAPPSNPDPRLPVGGPGRLQTAPFSLSSRSTLRQI